MQYICQACLNTGDNIKLMTSKEVTVYKNIICKSMEHLDKHIYICVFCQCLLRKLMKFIKQCQAALDSMLMQDPQKFHHQSPALTLTSTRPEVFYLGPEELEDIKPDIDSDEIQADNDIPLALLGSHDMCTDDSGLNENNLEDPQKFYRQSTELTLTSTRPEVFYLGPEELEDIKPDIDSDEIQSDNDIPLALLGSHDMCTDDSGLNDNNLENIKIIKEESHKDTERKENKKKKHKKKKKKPLREGFTSRMVQETNEYLVIKLSKEQVLQEMAENSKAEKYLRSPFKCDKCVKGFNFEDVLNSHLMKHSPKNGVLQCDLCSQYCASAVSLRGHMKSHTTRYKCKICGLVRLSRQHILEHHGIEHTAAAIAYTCDQCGFTTNKRSVIQHHVKTHTSKERHTCDQCGKLFKKLETLRVHVAPCAGSNIKLKGTECFEKSLEVCLKNYTFCEFSAESKRHDEKKRHPCEHCKLSFVYPSQLNKHVRSVHERKDYYCVECDVTFKSKATLKLHFQKAKRHRDPASYKYKCSVCEHRFISQSSLWAHESGAHGARKAAVCSLCPSSRAYSSRAALKVHMKRIHRKIDPSNIHTDEKPFKCECGAIFTQVALLQAHREARHKNSEEAKLVETIKTEQ